MKIPKVVDMRSELPSMIDSIEAGVRSERIEAIKQLRKRSFLSHLGFPTLAIGIYLASTTEFVARFPWMLPIAILFFVWNHTCNVEKRLDALILLSNPDCTIDRKEEEQTGSSNGE